MNFKTKAMALGTILALAVGATSALAGQNSVSLHSAKAAPRLLDSGPNEAKYVSLHAPCRIFDSRNTGSGGAFLPTVTRSIAVRGAACAGGIPQEISSVQLSIASVASTGNGYVRTGPGSHGIVASTVLNNSKGVNISTNAALSVCTEVCAPGKDIDIQVYNASTDLVIDVYGYFVQPMGGHIKADGTVDPTETSRIVANFPHTFLVPSATTPFYVVEFANDVTKCVITGTASTTDRTLSVAKSYGTPNQVAIDLVDAAGAQRTGDFEVLATC
ncbi:MAG: hypothetical protein JWP02_1228 [Acidimicrobiales bacterium]|nr:hypothetical protein [Acidimicrobiales bacterium]